MTVIVDKWLQRSGTKKSSQTSPVDKTTNDGQTKVTTVSTFLEIQTNYNITYYYRFINMSSRTSLICRSVLQLIHENKEL